MNFKDLTDNLLKSAAARTNMQSVQGPIIETVRPEEGRAEVPPLVYAESAV